MRHRAHHRVRARRLAIALATGSLMPLAGVAWPTVAGAQQEAARAYDIPAGPLSAALARFGAESGLLLSADAVLLDGRHSAGLQGSHTDAAALRRLLAGSGLGFRLTGGGMVVIEPLAAGDGPRAAVLEAVRIVARADSVGTAVLDRGRMDAIGAGNGDITSVLRALPNIQYDNGQLGNGTQGEIAPAEISIHGAKFYDNQFLFDGMSFSNDLDPVQGNPNEASRPSSSSQGLAIDTSLLCGITVHDANVPAEYGRFSGGVVSADTCAPTTDFSGRVSMEMTRSSWMEYKLTPGQKAEYELSTSDSSAPEFDKKTYRLALQGRPTENLGLIGSYVLKTSEIPLRAYNGGAASASDDNDKTEKRRSENLFLRGFWHLGADIDADFSFFHAPATSTNFIVNSRNAWFDIESGGQGVNLGLRHRSGPATVSHRLTWSEYESSREADASSYRVWTHSTTKDWGIRSGTTWNSSEGQYGDVEQKQSTLSYQVKADWAPFRLADTEHAFQTGLELSRQERYFHRLEDGAMYFRPAMTSSCMTAGGGIDAATCSMGRTSLGGWDGQFLSQATLYQAGRIRLDNDYRAVFGQYDLQWKTLRLRLGLRYEDDELAPAASVAPRGALFWDVFGDSATRVELGANRYYSRNFMSLYTRERMLALQSSATRSVSGGRIGDWKETAATSWQNYRSAELDLPYSDERMAGLSQRWAGAVWSLKWVERESRDEILRRAVPEGGWRYANEGKTSSDSLTFAVDSERPLRIGPTSTTFGFSVEKDDVRTTHADYEDGISDALWDSVIRYDGKFIKYNERPASNYNRPISARLLLTTTIPSARLTIGNLLRYRDSYRKFVRDGTADYGGVLVSSYALHTFRPAVTWDMRINHELPIGGGQAAFVALSIDNLLNRRNEIEDSGTEMIYEKGRQFWLEFGYRF